MCHLHQDLFMYAIVKCTRIRKIFKIDLLGNKASNEKILFFIIDLFFHVEVLLFTCTTDARTYIHMYLHMRAHNARACIRICIIFNTLIQL